AWPEHQGSSQANHTYLGPYSSHQWWNAARLTLSSAYLFALFVSFARFEQSAFYRPTAALLVIVLMAALALSKVCEIEKLAWPVRLTRAFGRLVLVLFPVSLSIYLLLLFVVSLTAQEPVLPFWREAAMR